MLCLAKWYNHTPEKVVENYRANLLLDYDIRTDHRIQASRPDIRLENKENQRVLLIDVVHTLGHRSGGEKQRKFRKVP